MADDLAASVPTEATLERRARAAGVDLDTLTDIARARVLREFYSAGEREALAARDRADMREDARRYNEHLEREGFWNASIKPW